MRCLFIVHRAPLSPRYRGGSGVFYEQLASLAALGHDVDLWHYAKPKHRRLFDEVTSSDPEPWQDVQRWCSSLTMTTLPSDYSRVQRLKSRWLAWRSGERLAQPLLRVSLLPQLERLIDRLQPDIIWAQTFWAAQVALMQRQVPVVYSHLDWMYRVKKLRSGSSSVPQMRQIEERIARQATAVISGSQIEIEQLRRLRPDDGVFYIPVAYEPAPIALPQTAPPPRIVHFGGIASTANRVGLERFYTLVWPQIVDLDPVFYQVGGLNGASETLKQFLQQVTCTGHVTDWARVLRPADLHIIPWEHSTGQRTRVPVALNYGQVLVAVRDGVAGFTELEDGVNCRLVDDLAQMGPVIAELLHDPAQRLRLGLKARQTFCAHFTREVLLPRYQNVVDYVLNAAALSN